MDPNNAHEVIFWDNLFKLRPWLTIDIANQFVEIITKTKHSTCI